MKRNLTRLSQRYTTALRKHGKHGPKANTQVALELGHEAVALGLKTADLARIHQRAIATLKLATINKAFTERAGTFFRNANAPIEEMQRATHRGNGHLGGSRKRADQGTHELAASKRQLQRGDVRRQVMEEAFVKNGKRHNKCLEESLELQKCLRQLTHRVLAAQEDERKKISCELRDEIAQTLLGINVRLLSLKKESQGDSIDLKNEITSAQRLVVKSAKSVRRFARELKLHPQSDQRYVCQVALKT